MARRRISSNNDVDDEVNVTPLLDIVFIMLIFFIVTSTFVKEPGIDPNRPEVSTAEAKRFGTILIAIDEDDNIWLNKGQVELEDIKKFVEDLRRENPKGTAVVQADAKSQTKTLVDVINRVRDAGMDAIAISADDA